MSKTTGKKTLEKIKLLVLLLGLLGLGLLSPGSHRALATVPQGAEIERSDGYYTVVDEKGKLLTETSLSLSVGDEYITRNNLRYRINAIRGDRAEARLVGKEAGVKPGVPPKPTLLQTLLGFGLNESKTIALYHTHSDESYVPTDGAASIYANGGIFKVGGAFKKSLQSLGLKVDHSLRPHDPHDANAYIRSRRTAIQLLQKQPMALIDVHRDAVPPNVYSTMVKGESITRVRIVVGTSNPRARSNLNFAKQIKATLDRTNPDLLEGILLTTGNFNQDLSPRALLVEVGAHTNSRYAAERGIAMFSASIPKALGVTGVSPTRPPLPKSNRGDWSALIWVMLIVGGGIAAYLWVNAGSWKGAWEQLRGFFQREFADISKRRRGR